jgi:hypothetical protein
MLPPFRRHRFGIIASLIVATLVTIVITGFRVWPEVQRQRAVSKLVDAIKTNDESALQGALESVDACDASDLAVSALSGLLHDESAEVRKKAVGYATWWCLDTPRATSVIVDALRTGDGAAVEAVLQNARAYSLMSSRPLPTWDELTKKRPQDSPMWQLKLICRYYWFATREFPGLADALNTDENVARQLIGANSSDKGGWDVDELVELLELASRNADPRVQKFATHALERLASAPAMRD